MPSLLIRGGAVDYTWIPGAADGRPTLVLLHEGLGSVSMWRDFPQQLALASGQSRQVSIVEICRRSSKTAGDRHDNRS